MALMTCPDCANQYPDDAPYCPNCGRPNPARQARAADASTGPAPETPATGPTGSPPADGDSAGTSSPPGGGFSAGAGSSAGGGTGGGAYETPAGGAYGGPAGGGYAGGGGYTPPPGGGGYGGYGGAPGGGSPPQAIPNYLVQAILVTLCCCLPFGIVSIIFASQVNSKRDMGDIAGAWEASKNAKKWAMIGAGVGVVWLIVVLAFNGLAFFAALASGAANQ